MSEPLWAPPVLLGNCRGIAGDKYLAYLARYEIGEGGGLNPAPEERLFALFQMPLPPVPIFRAHRAFLRSHGLAASEGNAETK